MLKFEFSRYHKDGMETATKAVLNHLLKLDNETEVFICVYAMAGSYIEGGHGADPKPFPATLKIAANLHFTDSRVQLLETDVSDSDLPIGAQIAKCPALALSTMSEAGFAMEYFRLSSYMTGDLIGGTALNCFGLGFPLVIGVYSTALNEQDLQDIAKRFALAHDQGCARAHQQDIQSRETGKIV